MALIAANAAPFPDIVLVADPAPNLLRITTPLVQNPDAARGELPRLDDALVYLRLDVRAVDATGSVPVGPTLAMPNSCRGRSLFVNGGDKERPVGSIAAGAVPRALSLPIVDIRTGTQPRARRRRSAAGSGGSGSRADLKGARGRRRRAGSGR